MVFIVLYVYCLQDERTPFHLAARAGRLDVTQFLQSVGADIEGKDSMVSLSVIRYLRCTSAMYNITLTLHFFVFLYDRLEIHHYLLLRMKVISIWYSFLILWGLI